ncbi:MAG: TIGR03086 family protein [Acidimicrobiia bacterium]|nr:TIGR03086 family protein [Acidimicrobiia bacterium]
MTTDLLDRALATAQGVLAQVQRNQLDEPTPCRSWRVRDLINHMIMAPRAGVNAIENGEMRADDTDYTEGDFVAAYSETARSAKDAFSDPGVADRMIKLPFAEVPGAFLMNMVTTDQFTHAWDLARSTGQSTDLDPELASTLLGQATIPDQFRGEDGTAPFGAIQPAPENSTAADRLAAHLGREV